MTSVCVLLVLGLGCRSAPPVDPAESGSGTAGPVQPPEAEPQKQPKRAATVEPACKVSVGEGGDLMVDGQVIPGELVDPNMTEGMRLNTFPFGPDTDSVLFGVGSSQPWWLDTNYPSDTLWLVPCKKPGDVAVYTKIEGANFGWAVADPDGTGLYFSLGAVHRFDFGLRDHGPVSKPPPPIAECWMQGPVEAIEYLDKWIGDDRMLIYWGGPCGFEAEWNGGLAVIEDPRGAATRRSAAYAGSIVADAKGSVWVSNGGLCVEATSVWNPGKGGVWRSDDVGESWTFFPIPSQRGVDRTTTSEARVSVRTECCYVGAMDECEPEHFSSDDGGRTWKRDRSGVGEAGVGRSVTVGEWVLEATLDGVIRRGVDGAGEEVVLLPGID